MTLPSVPWRRLADPAFRAVALAAAICGLAGPGIAQEATATLIGSFDWRDDRPGFGGFSGIEVLPGGDRALVLSDRGYVVEAGITRDGDGVITGVTGGPMIPLQTSEGVPVRGRDADSEGLTLLPDGRFCVSFENNARVSCYSAPGTAADLLPRPPDFARMPRNASLEALATDAEGRLYTMAEDPGLADHFPVWRYTPAASGPGIWEQPFSIPRRDAYQAVGADFGPDGRYYLLERLFRLAGGFSSRVRRFDLTGEGLVNETRILDTPVLVHGNLEGISVWQDGAGRLRMTLIADNAQLALFRNEIAEYLLEPLAQ